MKRAAVLAITILMTSPVFGQVHIKEGVVITPGQVKKTQSGGNNPHRFHIEISASSEDKTSIWITGPCLDSTFWFQGSMDINRPPAGSYGFNYAGFYWTGEMTRPWVCDNVAINIYFDDSLLFAIPLNTICFACGNYDDCDPFRYFSYPVQYGFSTPYISAFKLSILDPAKIFGNPFCKGAPFDPTGASGWNAGLSIDGVNDCSGTLWLPESDIITLSIVQGSQFVSFHRGEPHTPQEVNLGSVTTVIGGTGGVYLVPDGMDADSAGDWIVVRAESGTISSQDTVFLEPSYWHFYDPGPEDVEHMGEARIDLEPVNIYDHYIEIPDSTHLDISLDSAGMKYGSLQIGDSVAKGFKNVPWGSLPQWDEFITYVADGAISQQPVDAHVHVKVAYQDIPPLDKVLHVIPQPVTVTCTPSVISAGDTAIMTVKQLLTDGSLIDFGPDQQFEIGLSRGENYGAILLSDGESGGYFSYVSQPFKFIAEDSIDADSVVVRIRVGTQAPIFSSTVPGEKGRKGISPNVPPQKSLTNSTPSKIPMLHEMNSNVKNTPIQYSTSKSSAKSVTSVGKKGNIKSVSDANTFRWSNYGVGEVVIEQCSILLGETKYYYATEDNGSLIIHETSDPSSNPGIGSPSLIMEDLTISDKAVNNDKIGAYWDYLDPDGEGLPDGMIRVIGRYWKQDTTYKVTLHAVNLSDGKDASIEIDVKKPSKLFDPKVFNKPFNETWGIRNNHIDIDSLCIYYGGRIGIPPQVIKGQMYQESDKTNDHFNPSYRYEPWKDYNFLYNNPYAEDYAKQPFWITDADPMGEGEAIPMDHQNVKPIYYPTEKMSISDYAIKHWDLCVNRSNLEIVGSEELTKLFRAYYSTYTYAYAFPIGEGPYTIAARLIQSYIEDKYNDKAQTRKCGSYGLIQMLYTTAQVQGYNKGKSIDNSLAPEKLNDETIEMPFYQTFTERNLRKQFGGTNAVIPEGNWPKGWENTWMHSFGNYNAGSGYAQSVFNHAKKFYPQP